MNNTSKSKHSEQNSKDRFHLVSNKNEIVSLV